MQQTVEMLNRWLGQENLDESIKAELEGLTEQEEINERFYKDLEFGTGGLRGILGAGTNRMNIYTVRKATQGFADYINLHYRRGGDLHIDREPSVAIAYDSRINSDLFAWEAACVLAANGIKSYLYPELMPTPALSFAVRYYGCSAGIMVTASHNPSNYNGYKVYNSEGCQMTLDAAAEVLSLIEKVDIFNDVQTIACNLNLSLEEKSAMAMAFKDESSEPYLRVIPSEVTEAFLEAVKKESTGAVGCEELSVVYSPLNGTGNKPVRRILEMIGVGDVKVVPEQELPDGRFPTCPYPNPEKKEALQRGLELCYRLAEQGEAPDLLMATDPDCDRVGIAVRYRNKKTGEIDYRLLTGNEVGILLFDFICQKRLEAKRLKDSNHKNMPKEPIVIRTIVSSQMADEIAKKYGVKMISVLTGFKFIGEQVGLLEKQGEEDRYIFGFEESYGYLSGSYVRDKDAVNASMLICEMVAYYKSERKSLLERLKELYEEFGYFQNDLIEFAFEGAAGMEKMSSIMKDMRTNPPGFVIGKKVIEISDYQASVKRILGGSGSSGQAAGLRPIHLPKSDVLKYVLSDGSSYIVRPSGTEPKLKIYLSAKGKTMDESEDTIFQLKKELGEKII